MSSRPRYQLLRTLATAFLATLLALAPAIERVSLAETQPALQRSAGTEVTQANVRLFDEVWSRVRESFYDPKFAGLNWQAVGARYRPQLAEPGADPALIINRML